ncbi:MAG: carboxylesterase family protein [Phenylobacterium sp.]|uniref:carboxylesterase/lipase family protein n=1 Tax=Phenylobacterium sp. TaxID=1871053 RepID=UPI0026000B9E|nr:carboxylesterase family protein [Phenylobacterium sp.]MBI1196963.1 carboxylesterase family protein [Phenylobacterium sp.]
MIVVRPIALAAAIAASAFPVAPGAHAAARTEPAPVAKVETGWLVGRDEGGTSAFYNIPYAAPPVGELRWRAPRPPARWAGRRDARTPGPSCPQQTPGGGRPNLGGVTGGTDEDCLQVTVFAPRRARKAPVMVWIHGGSHRTGAGWVTSGGAFARDGVILVGVNYRLGPLGTFVHPALLAEAKPGEPVGNYGLMDQIAALKWVRRNIAAFGGDPDNVTLFGESAGGMSVQFLMAQPQTRGLFQRAIVESGAGWFRHQGLEEKAAQGVEMIRAVGLENATAAQLRALPADELIAKACCEFAPFEDGRLVKETPTQAFAAGRVPDVPLIIGWNSGEGVLMSPSRPYMSATVTPEIRAAYPEEAAAGEMVLARANFADRFMGAPARWVAAQAAGGKPSWLYYFTYVATRFRPRPTAWHADEIDFVFDEFDPWTSPDKISAEDRAKATQVHSCWVAFAKTGVPACAGGPAWPTYDPASDRLLEIGRENRVVSGVRKPQFDAQERLVLPGLLASH